MPQIVLAGYLAVQDQQKMAKVGLEMKLLTSEVDAEAEKWDEYAENDIVKRAKVSEGFSALSVRVLKSSWKKQGFRQCLLWRTTCTSSQGATAR